MRHNVAGRRLGRTSSHRLALFRNQLASLMAEERIITTLPKAKELRPLAERLVTHGKAGTVHARRLVSRWLPDRTLVKKLFEEIAPRHAERPGGYLRIVKLGGRQGDGAEMAVLEFVDFDAGKKSGTKAKSEAPAKPAGEKPRPPRSRRRRGAARGKSEGRKAGRRPNPPRDGARAAKKDVDAEEDRRLLNHAA